MNEYKPEYLGRIIPADSEKLLNLVKNNFEEFSLIYNGCKSYSKDIHDVQDVSKDGTTLQIRVITDPSVMDAIKRDLENADNVTVENDIISASIAKEN